MVLELDRIASARLRSDGQRYTAGRRALVEVLAAAGGPLTIPEVIARGDDLAQSSVYRNLAVLERAGVVRRVLTTDEWGRYELAEDLTEHHHHLICSACGAVEDFAVPSRLEKAIDAALTTAAQEAGFTLDQHRLDVVGHCGTRS